MAKLLRAIAHKYFIGKLAQGLVAKVYFGQFTWSYFNKRIAVKRKAERKQLSFIVPTGHST